jgi:hypothetical protein
MSQFHRDYRQIFSIGEFFSRVSTSNDMTTAFIDPYCFERKGRKLPHLNIRHFFIGVSTIGIGSRP